MTMNSDPRTQIMSAPTLRYRGSSRKAVQMLQLSSHRLTTVTVRIVLVAALAAVAACGSGHKDSPAVPGRLLDQQTVKVGGGTPSSVKVGTGEQAAMVSFPADATQTTQNIEVALSSDVTKMGATPVNNTVIQIITVNITFAAPAVLQQALRPPLQGEVYVAAHAAAGAASWTIGAAARLVGPAPTIGAGATNLLLYEIDIGGTGIWTIVLVSGGTTPDGGTDAGDARADRDPSSDAAPSACAGGGTGLTGFHPSNLPVPLDVPSGLMAVVAAGPCYFNTEVLTPQCSYPTPVIVTLSDGREAAVLFVETYTLVAAGYLEISGSRPLIIAANGNIDIEGTIVGAGNNSTSAWTGGGAPGPNSPNRAGLCPLDTASGGGRPGGGPQSAVGGGGAGFCGPGGHGSASADGGVPANGGESYGTADLIPIVGGSSGGSTDQFTLDNAGGGAIELVSGTSIAIGTTGAINMGGGSGGTYYGDGAGSGGAILIEAPSFTVRGVLAANGGAGATSSQSGLASDQPATGAVFLGATGGSGSAGAMPNGQDGVTTTSNTYAGGGGGAGRIRINTCSGMPTVFPSTIISPYESTGCYTKGTLK